MRWLVVLEGDDGLPIHGRQTLRVVEAESAEDAVAAAWDVPPTNATFALTVPLAGKPVQIGTKKSAAWAGPVGAQLADARIARRGDLEAKERGDA